MRRFVEGTDRGQSTLFPECLEDWICEDNPVRAIDVFVARADIGWLEIPQRSTSRCDIVPSSCMTPAGGVAWQSTSDDENSLPRLAVR